MPTFVWWILGLVVVPGILLWIVSYFVAAHCVYISTLCRTKPEKWGRELPADLSPQSLAMFEAGAAWAKEHEECCREVHIVNEGLNLYGEFYNFGYDRTVMVLSGRTDSLRYGYFFAIPYAKNGFNILVFDPRAHGKSDGKFNTVGFEEHKDTLAWARFLHDEHGQRSIVFHSLCIGAAGGIYALTSDDCPDYIDGIIAEGMFPNFAESMKNHLIENKKPVELMYRLINARMKHYTGHSMDFGPIDVIHKLKKPLLMLHSREDLYSTPEYAERLFALAGAEHKRLVWFEHGAHSMIRINNMESYDAAITAFLTEHFTPVT